MRARREDGCFYLGAKALILIKSSEPLSTLLILSSQGSEIQSNLLISDRKNSNMNPHKSKAHGLPLYHFALIHHLELAVNGNRTTTGVLSQNRSVLQ